MTPVVSGAPSVRWADNLCAGVHAAGCRHVVYVPDNPLSHVLRRIHDSYPDIRTLIATREEEAFGIAAGLYLGGARPAVMLQSSGLGNSLNAIASLLLPYQIPALVVISMRGGVGEWNAAQMPMGLAVVPILDALGVSHITVEDPDQAAEAALLVGRTAFGTRVPAACLLPRRLTAPQPRPDVIA